MGTIYDCLVTPVAHHSTQSGTAVAGVNHLPCVQSYLTKVYFLGWELFLTNESECVFFLIMNLS